MSFSSNKAVIQRFYAAWNAQQMEETLQFVAPTFVDHDPKVDTVPGPEGFRQARAKSAQSLTDVSIVIDDLLDAANNCVVAFVTIHATQIGAYRGIPYTGVPRRISWPAISVMRVAAGQLVEHWECADIVPILQTLRAEVVVPRQALPPDGEPTRGAHIL